MNKQITETFMAIYPNINQCFYQYFDDNRERKSRELTSFWDNLTMSSLEHLDMRNKSGAWIFFSVNGMEWRRWKDSVTTINAWICEIDDMDKEFQKQLIDFCPLKPSLVIESKNWFHLYRFAKEGTKENWVKICNWVRNFFDGDHKAITIERVLRLPGYYHMKDEAQPFEVTLYDWNFEFYTEAEMLFSYPNTESVAEKKEKKQELKNQISQYKEEDNFWERAGQLENRKMLEAISWTSYVSWEIITFKRNWNWCEQIFVNGKSTSSWIDSKWLIGSHDKGWPTWLQWVNWYWVADYKLLYQFIIWLFPDLKKTKEVVKNTSIRPLEEKKEVLSFLYPGECFNKFDSFRSGEFFMVASESNVGKSTFVNEIWQLAGSEYKVAFINIEFRIDEMLEIFFKRALWCTDDNIVRKWTNRNPYTELEILWLNAYIRRCKEKIDYFEMQQGVELQKVKEKIDELILLKYDLIIIDSFSSIADASDNLNTQIEIARLFHEIAKNTNITLLVVHHFSKWWKTYAGSSKIKDLANRFIEIQRWQSDDMVFYRKFILTKSKEHKEIMEVNTIFENHKYIWYDIERDEWHKNYKKAKEEDDRRWQ